MQNRNYYKYYGGHQFKLGHYYRHLFQSVKYINEQKILRYTEKYEYIKTLRAQLSTPEQYLLFFDSISVIGRDWELNYIREKPNIYELNKCLITKYNLIKNIPDWYIFDKVDARDFYPNVTFEGDEPSDDRLKLNSYFK